MLSKMPATLLAAAPAREIREGRGGRAITTGPNAVVAWSF